MKSSKVGVLKHYFNFKYFLNTKMEFIIISLKLTKNCLRSLLLKEKLSNIASLSTENEIRKKKLLNILLMHLLPLKTQDTNYSLLPSLQWQRHWSLFKLLIFCSVWSFLGIDFDFFNEDCIKIVFISITEFLALHSILHPR